VEKAAGANIVYTCPPAYLEVSRNGRHLNFETRSMNRPTGSIGEAAEDPLFQKGYAEDVIPSMSSTPIRPWCHAKEFSGATQSMVDFVSQRVAQYCG